MRFLSKVQNDGIETEPDAKTHVPYLYKILDGHFKDMIMVALVGRYSILMGILSRIFEVRVG